MLQLLIDRVATGRPMALARYCDGEYNLIHGLKVYMPQAEKIDRWAPITGRSDLGDDLMHVLLSHTEPDYWYGIAPACCCPKENEWYKSKVKGPMIQGNLYNHGDWEQAYAWLTSIPEISLIANKACSMVGLPWLIKKFFPVENELMKWYEFNRSGLFKCMVDFVKDMSGQIVLVSAGPMSAIIIHHMWSANKNNIYLDVGSCLDPIIHGRKTRDWMISDNIQREHFCKL